MKTKSISKFLFSQKGAVILFFSLWISLLDSTSVSQQIKLEWKISSLKSKIRQLEKETEANKSEYLLLSTKPEALVKYAREKFLMKRKNETIFLLKDELTEEN